MSDYSDDDDDSIGPTNNHHFEIQLHEETSLDQEANFRHKNSPGEMQRPVIVDRDYGKGLFVTCDLIHVVHGRLSRNGPPATLIVLRFQFPGSQSKERRIKKADIEVSFLHEVKNSVAGKDAQVIAIEPEGGRKLEREVLPGTNFNTGMFSLTPPVPNLVTVSGSVPRAEWRWGKSQNTRDATAVVVNGVRRVKGRSYGTKNAAFWNLQESNSLKDGVPSYFQTALLVSPGEDSGGKFHAQVRIRVEIDLSSKIKDAINSFTGMEKVDPVFFRHGLPDFGPTITGLDAKDFGDAVNTGILKALGECE